MELAGDIEAVGKDVTLSKIGNTVFASTEFRFGTYAQYCCIPEDGILAIKPNNILLGENQLPPAPPTGVFDCRFIGTNLIHLIQVLR